MLKNPPTEEKQKKKFRNKRAAAALGVVGGALTANAIIRGVNRHRARALVGGRTATVLPRSAAIPAGAKQLSAALDAINLAACGKRITNFAANPSGDPRPRNRMGQFDQPAQDDPVQQNKAAYAPQKRRRTAAMIGGGVLGVGAGAGLLLAKRKLKNMRPIAQYSATQAVIELACSCGGDGAGTSKKKAKRESWKFDAKKHRAMDGRR